MAERTTLLLVDDEEENLLVISTLLETEHRVHTASSVPEALALLEAESVDVLITDQRMPGMSGVELLRQARRRHPHVVRIALTAYTDIDLILDAINDGAVYRYIIKPWSVDEMRTTIRQAAEWGKLQREHGALAAELSRINKELQARNAELERRNEELSRARARLLTGEKLATVGRFATGMVHEMNQHLLVLQLLNSSFLQLEVDPETREELAESHEHTVRLARLIRDVQEFARGETPALSLQPVDPVELVHRVIRLSRHVERADRVEVGVEAGDVGTWSLDAGKVMHLVANLLRNALAVSPPGAPVVIRVARQGGEALRIEVEDRGPGVPADRREWVFEPFASTKGSDGMGLGLTICRWVASLHGGAIEVRDGQAGGALFVVTFPASSRVEARPGS